MKIYLKIFIFIITCFYLSACSQSVPVIGKVEKTDENFVGTATGNIFGQGSLSIKMDSGAICESEFRSRVASANTAISSHGDVSCSDGRTGNFFYSGTVYSGNGFGTLSDGHKFSFVYGR